MRGLSEVVQLGAAGGGGEAEPGSGEVVAQERAGEGCDQRGRGAQAGFVGVLETDAEVCEAGVAIGAGGAGLRVVVVVCEDGDRGGVDRGGQHGGDVG